MFSSLKISSRKSTLLLSIAILTGCSSLIPNYGLETPSDFATKSKVENDEYQKMQIIRGPIYKVDGNNSVAIRSFKKNENIEIQFVFWTVHPGLHNYYSAFDLNGREFPVQKIALDRYKHIRTEEVSITVPLDYLKNNQHGASFKLIGQYGSSVVDIPGAYIQGFLYFME